ncbi:MAG: DUF1295 domain-containing protein [Anaerolineae bacterium]
MSLFELAELSAGIILVYVLLIWLLSLALKNASIMDIFWGMGFVTLAVVALLLGGGAPSRKLLVATLVGVWGLRLSLHILLRNWGRPEDYRYRAWRKQAGNSFWFLSLFQVFLLQGLLLVLVAGPILAAESSAQPNSLTLLDLGGTIVWAIGFYFEAVGDWQLEQFKRTRSSPGQVLRTGLWAWTRHPNYFGDALVWWGLALIALATPGGFLLLYSPVLMTILLLRVSGVALLEKGLAKTKPEYRQYIASTSSFIPWFPRNGKPGKQDTHEG